MGRYTRLLFALALTAAAFGQVSNQSFGRGIWHGQPVTFRNVDGWAIIQGDLMIGRAADQAARYQAWMAGGPALAQRPGRRTPRNAEALNVSTYYWPSGIVPYTIDSVIADTTSIQAAVDHWNSHTVVHFVPRTNQKNYVRFTTATDPSVCSSSLGMQGGEQLVLGGDTCPTGPLIHELGHALGLEHEMARSDRDSFIRIIWENMQPFAAGQFSGSGSDFDVDAYDFGSIMHYGVGDFSNGNGPVMQTLPSGIPIRQMVGLSAGDIDAIDWLYGPQPTSVTISTTPPGLQVIVDGATVTAPQAFNWTSGSTHTLDVPGEQSDGQGRYEFALWSDTGDSRHDIKADPANVTLYTANFVRYNKFNFQTNPPDAGTVTVSPASSDGYYQDGTLLTITAQPNDGYNFVNWSGPPIDAQKSPNLAVNPVKTYAHATYQGSLASQLAH